MVKVLFVCLGNICRSPMAEGLFRKRVIDEGLEKEIFVDSKATSSWEVGHKPHRGTIDVLKRSGAYFDDMKAVQITKSDFDDYDIIIGMDDSNVRELKRLAGDQVFKVHKYLDVCDECLYKDIADPYYTLNFEKTFQDINTHIDKWMSIIRAQITK